MNSPPPSRTDAWARLRAAAPPDWVLGHVACVERLAVAIARRLTQRGHDVDESLVQAGAVLHDIGRSITQDPTHAHRGAQLLRDAGLDGAVVRIVERHTGAGLTADEAAALGLPQAPLIPTTLEEKVVAHADNLFSGSKRLRLADLEAKYAAKRLPAAWARIQALHEELSSMCGMDLQDLEPADLAAPA